MATSTVLFLHYGDAWLRGSEVILLELLRGLDRKRFDPVVVSHATPLREACLEAGIEAHVVPFPEIMFDGGYRRFQVGRLALSTARIRSLLRGRRPGLVYCNGGLAAQLGAAVAALLRAPRLAHLHAPFYRRYYWLWMLWSADTLVFACDATRAESLRAINHRGRVAIVPNGVDLARFQPAGSRDPAVRGSLGIPGDVPVAAQIASLIERKAGDTVLRAFARICSGIPAHLVLAGDGEERVRLRSLAQELGIERRVCFTGEWTTGTDQLLRHVVDVNVLASRQESFPISLLEASACGVPSVTTPVGGTREIVLDEVTGLVVPVDDIEAMAGALLRVLVDDHLRHRMGEAARRRAEQYFDARAYVRAMEGQMEKLMARGR